MNANVWELLPSGDKRNVAFIPRHYLKINSDWFSGRHLSDVWQSIPVDTLRTRGRFVDFVSFLPGAIAVSQRALEVLQPIVGSHCEFLPLVILRNQRFFAMNVTNVVDCIDQKQSEIDYAPDNPKKILAVRKMYFRYDVMTNAPVFKAFGYKSAIYVGPSFVSAVVTSALKGAAFADPSRDRLSTILRGQHINVVEGVIP